MRRSRRRSHSRPPDYPSGPDATAQGPDGPPPSGGRSRRRYDPAWDDWRSTRRWPGVLLTCAIVLGFMGVVVWHYRPHPAPQHKAQFTKNQLSALKPPFAPSVAGAVVYTFHGTKSHTGYHFFTTGSLLLLHATCDCAFTFVATIANSSGTPIASPIGTTGIANVTLDETLARGLYSMSVVASGPWEIQLIRPTPSSPDISTSPRPFKYFSSGSSLIGPFSSASRLMDLQFALPTGVLGTIRVFVLNGLGQRVETAFASQVNLNRRVALARLPNPYYLEVDASSGIWQLIVQHTSHH